MSDIPREAIAAAMGELQRQRAIDHAIRNQLVIDGAQVPDPNSLYYYGASRWGSGVEVPAKDQEFYALKNVPHGDLRQVHFYSKSADAVLRRRDERGTSRKRIGPASVRAGDV